MDGSPLTNEEVQGLASLARAGDRGAEAKMVESVVDLVRWLAARHGCPGVALDDLVQEGLLAAVEASRTYNPTKGRWPAWAALHAESAMRHLASRRRIVPIPGGQRRMAGKYVATRDALRKETGFEPTAEEVRRRMGITEERFGNAVAAEDGPASRPVCGLDAIGMAPARAERDELECYEEAQSEAALRAALRILLGDRDAQIFWLRNFDGLATWKIAARLNTNHARIKAAERRAAEKLRGILGQTAA